MADTGTPADGVWGPCPSVHGPQASRQGPKPAHHTAKRPGSGNCAFTGKGAVDCSGKRVWGYVEWRTTEGEQYK